MNFSLENLFSALSGMSSGGTSSPYTSVSNPTGNVPSSTSPSMQQPMQRGTSNFNPQGTWQGNMTPQQPQNPQQGTGLTGMFRDIMGRAPAIYNAMKTSPGAPPMASFMNGMNRGMMPNGTGRY